ncbi:MAG: OmpA family protein [Candidatus Omnitrophica bacterium]|nr:OmpA family protein [Candidatus Omnitrophota bacterium]
MKTLKPVIVIFLSLLISGCTVTFQKGRRSDIEKIDALSRQLIELEDAKRFLEERLAREIADEEVRLQMLDKGLVITFVADVLFDSGQAKIRPEAYAVLDKVARVLNENVVQFNIGIEGHTDNEPIKHSGWKSNWELSTARALSVLHYLVDERNIAAQRVSAIGYGEYKPVAPNDTSQNRRLNRRVEIVVLPNIAKQKDAAGLKEPEESLK